QKVRHFERIRLLAIETQFQCLHASEEQIAVEGPKRGTFAVLNEIDLLRQFGPLYGNHSRGDVAMAAEILGRRVHDDVGPQIERILQVRRHRAAVHAQQRAMLVRQVSQLANVNDAQQRVRWGLDVKQSRSGSDLRGKRLDVAGVGITDGYAGAAQDPGKETVGSTVQIISGENLVSHRE